MERKFSKNQKLLVLLLNCFFFFFVSILSTQAQNHTIKGTIADSTGVGVEGASVNVQGTNKGVVTNSDGEYSIDGVSNDATLVISHVGFTSQSINVNGRSTIDLVLHAAVTGLGAVVVVGYGTQKVADLTGAVSTISSKQLSVVPTANVTTLLAGQLPGLIVVQRSGQPGADAPDLSIRGFGSPLVIVDGIQGRDFTRLDPSEIESITVLKDAASAAVYGVSAGNGVILVTTKRGNIGKPEFNYQSNYSVQTFTKFPTYLNSAQYATMTNEASIDEGGPVIYSPQDIQKFQNGSDPLNFPNVDYWNYYVRKYTPQFQQNLTVRGGSNAVKYFFLLGGISQQFMYKGGPTSANNNPFKNYNFKSNVDARIDKNLDISVDFGANNQIRNNPPNLNLAQLSQIVAYSLPIYNPLNPDGTVSANNFGQAALLNPKLVGYVNDNLAIFNGNLSINYKIPYVQGLSAKVTLSEDLSYENNKNWQLKYSTYNWNAATNKSTVATTSGRNQLTLSDTKKTANEIQASLNYSRTFLEKHNITALLLYDESENASAGFSATRQNYAVLIDQLFAGPLANQLTSGTASDDGRKSLVGRLNYNFKDKYLLEYSFRYDGSPRFPPATRWGYFYGISGGWRLSEENFIKNNFKAISNLKLRLSYGKLGDDNTGNFQYLTGFTYPSGSYVLGNNGSVSSGLLTTGVPNPNITWETSYTYDAGLDIDMWGRLFGITADIYYRQRKGILATRSLQLPSTYGATLSAENLNSDNARGFEFEAHHSYHIGPVHYDISANFNYSMLRYGHIEQAVNNSAYDRWINNLNGRNENITWGSVAIGQFQTQAEINSSPVQDGRQNSTLRPGDIKYADLNHDGVIDGNDLKPIGYADNPEFTYGLSINLNWKKFGLATYWSGAAGFEINDNLSPSSDMNWFTMFMDRWHHQVDTDPNTPWVPGKFPSFGSGGGNSDLSTFWLKSAAFLRLKSMNLNYTWESKYFKKIGLQRVVISISGQDLLDITGLQYLDPETPAGNFQRYYPQQKTYNLGVNIIF